MLLLLFIGLAVAQYQEFIVIGPNTAYLTKDDMFFNVTYHLVDNAVSNLSNSINLTIYNNGYVLYGMPDYERFDNIPISDNETVFDIVQHYTEDNMINQNIITNNDRLLIQIVLNNFANNGGGTIYVGEGLYVFDMYLYIPNNTHIKGSGMDKTIFKLEDYARPFLYNSVKRSGFIRGRHVGFVILSNMTLDGNKNYQNTDDDSEYGRYGIFTEGYHDAWFDYVRVTNFQGYGFDPHGHKSMEIWGKNLTITNCVSDNNNWDGFTLDQSINIYVDNCTALNNGRHGFNTVTGSVNVEIYNSVSIHNGYYYPHGARGCGYMFQNNLAYGTNNCTLGNSTSINNSKAGICLNDVYNIVISNNSVSGTCNCMEIINTRTTTISNNICNTSNLYRFDDVVELTNTTNVTDDISDYVIIIGNVLNYVDCKSVPGNDGSSAVKAIISINILLILLFINLL